MIQAYTPDHGTGAAVHSRDASRDGGVRRAGPLRGRDEELARANAILRRTVTTGQGGVIIVSGEPGIGKSALLHAIGEQASEMTFAIGAGKAEELHQIAPMQPLLVALRSGRSPLLSRNEFVELAPLYNQQLWLVDRLGAMLEERALQSPLLIVIDDVQWADHLSAFALRVMPGRLAGSAIVWLLATRLHPAGTANEIVAAVSRDVLVESIALDPLRISAIDALALDYHGVPPSGRLRELLQRAEGFPFLAVELLDGYARKATGSSVAAPAKPVQLHVANDSMLPSKLVVGVRNRLESLPIETLRLVQVASVMGRSFAIEDAAALLQVSPWTAALPSLAVAVRAGVLEDQGELIAFRHDLFRQAVYEDVSPSMRRSLHREAAHRMLAAGGPPLHAAQHVLAYAQRGDREAVETLRRAAASVASTMPPIAAQLIEHAFALMGNDDPAWLETGQEAIAILMRARRGRDATLVANRLLATPIRGETAAHIQMQLSRLLWETDRIDDMRARVEAALAIDGVSEWSRAELLALQALALSRADDSTAAIDAGERALKEARRVGNRAAESDALRALGEASRNDGRNDIALRHFKELRQLIPQAARTDEIISLQLLDRYDASLQLLSRARTDSEERRDISNTPDVAFAQMWHDYGLGLLDEAETDAKTLLQICEDFSDHRYAHEARLILCRVPQLRGDLAAARSHLELATHCLGTDDEGQALMLSLMRAWLAESEGNLDAAVSALRDVLRPPHGVRHRWRWQPAWLAAAARIAIRGGDRELAQEVGVLARIVAERNPNVATAEGVAAQVRGLVCGDLGSLRRAVERLRASPRQLVRADAMADLGSAELAHGRRDPAAAALEEAWEIFNRLGADGEARRVQKLLQTTGVRRRRWSTASPRPLEGWDALTDAEQRVARLIADGHTNRSAANELVLGPATVATHLRSIFGKLSVTSRSQLTRVVIEQR